MRRLREAAGYAGGLAERGVQPPPPDLPHATQVDVWACYARLPVHQRGDEAWPRNKVLPPPPRGRGDIPSDSAKGLRKRVWSKPTILVFNDVSDVDSAVQTHPTRGDNQNPIHLYAPTS